MNEERNLRALLNRLRDSIKDSFDHNEFPEDRLRSITEIFNKFTSSFKDYPDSLNKDSDLFIFIKEKLSELQGEIDNQPSEENGMTPEADALAIVAKIATVGGTLLVIGIALARILYDKRKKKAEDNSTEHHKDTFNKPSETSSIKKPVKQLLKNGPPPKNYQLHHLLLIIPANQSDGYKTDQQINNVQVNKLIANSVRAYCFSGGKGVSNEIAEGVVYNDDVIDVTTESRVFVHLLLSAEPSILDERIRLNISDKIEPNTTIEIVKIAKLQTARSTTAFYEI